MKIIFDTNVLLSAFLHSGLAADVFDVTYLHHDIFISQWILNEFTEKCRVKFRISKSDLNLLIEHVKDGSTIIEPDTDLPDICRDKDDNNILQLATAVKADFIVTGDSDLLDLKSHKGTKIVNPRTFWTKHLQKFSL